MKNIITKFVLSFCGNLLKAFMLINGGLTIFTMSSLEGILKAIVEWNQTKNPELMIYS